MPALTLTGVNLDSPDPARLARFYAQLLGWRITTEQEDDVQVGSPTSALIVSTQRDVRYRRPVWPSHDDEQRMMAHLEIHVDDLDGAVAHALACGATLAASQPQDDVRVCLDPDGHPFCLYT
jgi:catechol 2,3-dioxygenase-like lactoylglutathione lyase family enzyme